LAQDDEKPAPGGTDESAQQLPPQSGQDAETRLEIERLDDPPSAAIILLAGYFYHKQAKQLTEKVEDLALQGIKNVIFDMTDLLYMNSSAIASLATCASFFKGRGGNTILMPRGATVMKVLETLGLLGMFTTTTTREEAIKAIS
jgi:anti-anti-sigma factor